MLQERFGETRGAMSISFVVPAVGTGVVVIAVAVAIVLVVLFVTLSMRGRQRRGAERRGEARRDIDEAREQAGPAEHGHGAGDGGEASGPDR
jgi:hypothetical protein